MRGVEDIRLVSSCNANVSLSYSQSLQKKILSSLGISRIDNTPTACTGRFLKCNEVWHLESSEGEVAAAQS